MRIIRFLFIFIVLFVALIFGLWLGVQQAPGVDLSALEHYRGGAYSVVLDDAGNELMRFQTDRREYIVLAELPRYVVHAFLSAEDQHFFEHSGISLRAIVRSMLVNISRGRIVQGASTITQQLVKLLFLTSRREFGRKIREQFMALLVERQFTKEQILEIYLNHIYFGVGIYGVEAASQRFFGVSARHMTCGQAALLASIVRAPERRCPVASVSQAQQGRNVVLATMRRLSYITDGEYHAARAETVLSPPMPEAPHMVHLRAMLRAWCEETFGYDQLYHGQLVIQTTINKQVQQHAYASLTHGLGQLHATKLPGVDGALAVLDYTTGAIKGLVGGYDGVASPFNRATQSRRQLGSAFKPLVYAAACARGRSLHTIELDEPIAVDATGKLVSIPEIGQDMAGLGTAGLATGLWEPQNLNHTFVGSMTLAHALATSNNIVAIKLLLQVGIDEVVKLAQRSGCAGYVPSYPSLALGTAEVSPLEAAGLYGMLCNRGMYEVPYLVQWVKDAYGNKIWRHIAHVQRVLPWHATSAVVYVLEKNVERLRKKLPYNWPTGSCMGKSGTTNDSRSCWFVGGAATSHLVAAVYVGYDDNRSMGNVLSSQVALPIWTNFMAQTTVGQVNVGQATRGGDERDTTFAYDPRLIPAYAHVATGELVRDLTAVADPARYGALLIPR